MAEYGLTGKTAFVTGGASGIGAATARMLAAEGARVAIADANGPAAERHAETLAAGGAAALPLALDVRDGDAVEAAAARAEAELGPLRLAVSSAGIAGAAHPMGAVPATEWRNVISVNLDGAFHATNAALPRIAAAGGGAIVNVASVMGSVAVGRFAAYVASKHGLIGLTKSAALDGAPLGVRVNAVAPGYIDTPMQEGRMDAARRAELAAAHPLGRWGAAEEAAAMILWLLSDLASFATGGVHHVDGGYVAV